MPFRRCGKKLKELARALYGRSDDTAISNDLKAFGAPPELLKKFQGDDSLEVWPSNRDAFRLFRMLGSQWKLISGFGGVKYQGLDYSAMLATAEMMKIEMNEERLMQIRIMEIAAVEVLNG